MQLTGIRKAFGSNEVLHDISFTIDPGQVTVLMGANGAGKSTLVKILSAVHERDAGNIELNGKPFNPQSPSDAMAQGVVTVHQSINDGVVPDLDIASNLLLENLALGECGFWVTQASLRKKAQRVADLVGLTQPLDTQVHQLALADRQMVAIARAMAYEPRVLVLDEPTSSLSATEADRLFSLIEKLRSLGVAILYISHRMSDIRRLADNVVVMRDGRISATMQKTALNLPAAITAMLGRSMDDINIAPAPQGSERLKLSNVVISEGAKAFNMHVNDGEIVAVAGLIGSGKTALANVLFGLQPTPEGEITLQGTRYKPASPAQAIARGVFLCPRDRSQNAVIPDFNLTSNITLPFLSKYSRAAWLNRRAERLRANQLVDDMSIVCRSAQDAIATLSGGNQQKVTVARWLAEPSALLILDEPFQGVDIQARRDIGERLRSSAGKRGTLMLVSEIEEAIEVADRIVVLADHSVVGEHINRNPDMDLILAQMASAVPEGASAA